MKTHWWSEEWHRLRDTDLQALDLKEAGAWPLSLRGIVLVMMSVLALTLIYWWGIKAHIESLSAAKREESRLLTEFRQKVMEATYRPQIEQQLLDMGRQLQRLRIMLPADAEIPALLDSISDAALGNHLSVETIRLREASRQALHIEYPFDIEVQGDYHDIARFLAAIAALPRMVTLHDFVLEPIEDGNQALSLAILATTYSDRPLAEGIANDSVQGAEQ